MISSLLEIASYFTKFFRRKKYQYISELKKILSSKFTLFTVLRLLWRVLEPQASPAQPWSPCYWC